MKAGDIVRFLNAVGGGKVTRIEGNIAYVEDSDGFETPTLVKECVVVDPDGGIMPKKKFGNNESSKYEAPAVKKEQPAKMPDQSSDDIKIAETPEGNVLNIVLAYEPDDIRNFSTSPISAYLVNDSNYYLYAVYATTGGNGLWACRFDGLRNQTRKCLSTNCRAKTWRKCRVSPSNTCLSNAENLSRQRHPHALNIASMRLNSTNCIASTRTSISKNPSSLSTS